MLWLVRCVVENVSFLNLRVLMAINGQEVVIAMPDLDLDFELLRCEQQIADLTVRIKQLKEASPSAGSGFPNSPFIEVLQQNLESWQERKKTLADLLSEQGHLSTVRQWGRSYVGFTRPL
jgi:hypothetical protein